MNITGVIICLVIALIICLLYRKPYKKGSIVQVQFEDLGLVTCEVSRIKRFMFLVYNVYVKFVLPESNETIIKNIDDDDIGCVIKR